LNEAGVWSKVKKYRGELNEEEQKRIVNDILDAARKYRFSADEYFCYHFDKKSEDERKTFISDLNRIDFCEALNKSKNLYIFDDKSKSAEVFANYYKRDLCTVKRAKDLENFKSFLKKHERFIIKPLVGSGGKGIKILTVKYDDDHNIAGLFNDYCKGGYGFIAEELVTQVKEMSVFHPSSLNTVRLATVLFDEGAEVIAAFFRTGRGGNVVDNAGAGGVFGTINIETGIIEAVGDEYGNSYDVHPDTGEQLVGFKIPRWEEAKELAMELATVVKGNRYAGWDLALSPEGWVMIEGNARGQFVWQMPSQKGYMADANQILVRQGLKEITRLGV
jgi:hypothetical protein